MRIALVHDHLVQFGGAERVLEVMQSMWPEAPTFTLLYDKQKLGKTFGHRDIRTSFLQHYPFSHRNPRWFLPFMPTATESYDLSEFDVVISSSSAFAKGIITRPETLHICYCHTPTRYLWTDTHSYVAGLRLPAFIKHLLPYTLTPLRMWDKLAADRVDYFLANAYTVKHRISSYYNKESTVLYPPVDTSSFAISNKPKEYFLIGGRLVDYKRYDLVIEAFNKLGLPLIVFGSGPMEKTLKKMAQKNITFMGAVSDEKRVELFEGCKAFLHPHEEDFGITTVEAMAAGRPVIALRKGGATETVIDGVTGIFFDKQEWEELAATILHFDETHFDPMVIRKYAEQFSTERFRKELGNFVADAFAKHAREKLGRL